MMKLFLLLVAAGAAFAQDMDSLPTCGQTCINNMIDIAQNDFGCSEGDTVCYCTNQDFGYGIRDCAREACANAQDAAQVIVYGDNYCSSIQESASGSSASAIATGAGSVLSSAAATLTNSEGSIIAGPTASGAESTFATITSAASSAASSVVSSIESEASELTESLVSSVESAVSSALSSFASSVSEATDSAGNTISSATDSAGSAISSATETAGSANTDATDTDGAAPRITGLPVAGAVGLAAWLLL